MEGAIMKFTYDPEADAAYFRLSKTRPQAAVEVREGVILHVTENDKIVGIEILDAKLRLPIPALMKSPVAAARP